jgi:tRNA (pseudouridine54-N1)-methyltransferase
MRRFLLTAHRVPVRGEFSLNDLAGLGGRMDEVARSVSTAFTLSNELRRDTAVTVLFVSSPPPAARRIDLAGDRLRYLNPDERSTAALLKNALVRSAERPYEFEPSPGLRVAPADPPQVVAEFLARPGAAWLTESGGPLSGWSPTEGEAAFVLSDPDDPTPTEVAALEASGVPRLSVGPRSLRTSQVIDVVQRELDLRLAPRSPTPGARTSVGSPR